MQKVSDWTKMYVEHDESNFSSVLLAERWYSFKVYIFGNQVNMCLEALKSSGAGYYFCSEEMQNHV